MHQLMSVKVGHFVGCSALSDLRNHIPNTHCYSLPTWTFLSPSLATCIEAISYLISIALKCKWYRAGHDNGTLFEAVPYSSIYPGDSADGIIVKQILDKERCSCLKEGDIIVAVSSGTSHQPHSPTSSVAKIVPYLKRIDTGSQATFHIRRPSRECTNLCQPDCMTL